MSLRMRRTRVSQSLNRPATRFRRANREFRLSAGNRGRRLEKRTVSSIVDPNTRFLSSSGVWDVNLLKWTESRAGPKALNYGLCRPCLDRGWPFVCGAACAQLRFLLLPVSLGYTACLVRTQFTLLRAEHARSDYIVCNPQGLTLRFRLPKSYRGQYPNS